MVVIVLTSLFSYTQSSFTIRAFDDWIAKRSLQRRSFLKSFCARRCNIGKGGNVCKCNGFHFAGKRSDGETNVLLSEDPTMNVDNTATTDVIYKMLEDNDKIEIKDDQYDNPEEDLVQGVYKPNIHPAYSDYLNEHNKNR